MGWNYRVIAHDNFEEILSKLNPELKAIYKKEIYFEIVEMYYDKEENPNGYTEGKTVGGESIKSLNWSLNKMKLALKKPIISVKNFPK